MSAPNEAIIWRDEKIAALEAQNQQLRAELESAANSLETIETHAGRDEYLKYLEQIRGYAHSRSLVARAALAATEPKP